MSQLELGLYITIGIICLCMWSFGRNTKILCRVVRLIQCKEVLTLIFTFGAIIGYIVYAIYTCVVDDIDIQLIKIAGSLLNTLILILSWYVAEWLYRMFAGEDGVHLNLNEKNVCNLIAMAGSTIVILINGDGEEIGYSMVFIIIAVFISTYWGVAFAYNEYNLKKALRTLYGEFSGVPAKNWIINIVAVVVFIIITVHNGLIYKILSDYRMFAMGSYIGLWMTAISVPVCTIIGKFRKKTIRKSKVSGAHEQDMNTEQ